MIALLMNPNNASAERVNRDVQDAAHTKGLRSAKSECRTERVALPAPSMVRPLTWSAPSGID